QYVLEKEDIEVKVSNFYTKIQSPVLTDVALAVAKSSDADVRLEQVYPRQMPDLFKGQTLLAFGRYSGSGENRVNLTGTIDGERVSVSTIVDFPKQAEQHRFIPRLWATRRIGWLLDEIRLHGDSKELKDEVVHLARE